MAHVIKFILQEIPSNEIEWVELIRKGKFKHSKAGKIDITEKVLKRLKENFDGNARRVDIAVDYFHESYAEAAGWVKQIELRDDNNSLWINVEWTEKAKEKLLSKEIRYISADFSLNYEDSETGAKFGATLFGAGLTNRPHVKDMQPISLDEDLEEIKTPPINFKDNKMVDFNEILESVGALSEDEKLQLGEKIGFTIKASAKEATKLAEEALEANKIQDDKAAAKESTIIKLSDEVEKLKTSLVSSKQEIDFNIMLSGGKVVESQRVAFMDNNIIDFAKNATPLNLSEVGSGSIEASEEAAESKYDQLVEKKAADKGITLSEASKIIVKENPELVKKFNG